MLWFLVCKSNKSVLNSGQEFLFWCNSRYICVERCVSSFNVIGKNVHLIGKGLDIDHSN